MPRYIDRVKLYTDGGCRGNPGPGAIGYIILDENNNEIDSFAECIGGTTNNRAEYFALIRGLECAASHTRGTVYCFLDSEFVIKQVTGEFRIRTPELRPFVHQVLDNMRLFSEVTFQHLPNTNPMIRNVDRLVKQAMEGR
ncbi:MAG: reverse transcriptase-like protein [Candidatus Aminicenantes bacterium]|nr:reverse transcriptase-like protein [Candidatus Aminicenantes bacterium]